MNEASIPILLVEDNPSDIEIIRMSLKKGGLFNTLHLARDGQEAIDFLHRRSAPLGVILLDIRLPKMDGMEVLKEAKQIDPELVVIMLTGQASLKTAIQSLRRGGAFDYLQKSKDDLAELVDTVRLAVKKRALHLQTLWMIQSKGGEHPVDMIRIQEKFSLTQREVDVVKCLCRGDANKEIAMQLFISEMTVKSHLKNIYQKIGVQKRVALVSMVLASAVIGGGIDF